jgi:O-antigen/teichoic acid export membrane protein
LVEYRVSDVQGNHWSGMNFKVFGKNTIIYAIGNACARLGAFLLIPLYTHSLALGEFGLLSTLLITTQIITIMMSLGTQKGFIRFANECEKENLLGKLLGSTVTITIAGAIPVIGVCLILLLPFFRILLHTNEVSGYMILTCLAALFQALFTHVTSYYRVKNKSFNFIIANLAALLLLIATNIVFLRILAHGVKGVLMAQVVTYGSLWLILFISLIAKTGLGFSWELAKNLLWFSFPLLSAMLWDLVMDTFAVYFLGYFRNLEQVAIYSLGYKIAQIAYIILILPFQLAYEPLVYGHLDDEIKTTISKLLTYLMLVYSFLAFGIVFLSQALLSVIAPPSYFSAYTVVFLMLPGIAFTGVYYVAESLFGIKNKTSLIGGFVTIFTIGSIVLNYLLIPLWGMYGTIFVFNVIRILTAIVLMVVGLKIFPIRLEERRLGVIGALFVFFLFLVFLLHGTQDYIYYTAIPAAACTTLCLLYFGNFFNDQEKASMKKIFQHLCLRISKRKLIVD